jgi:hypothetical protein
LGTRVRVRAILTGECRWGLPGDDVEVDQGLGGGSHQGPAGEGAAAPAGAAAVRRGDGRAGRAKRRELSHQ